MHELRAEKLRAEVEVLKGVGDTQLLPSCLLRPTGEELSVIQRIPWK